MEHSVFEQNRRRRWGIAYRMLGSRADAEDMVQETWLRWHSAVDTEIRVPQAWLVTTVTRAAHSCEARSAGFTSLSGVIGSSRTRLPVA
jgi:DNA-directed RNA polymerase specialized sigma24 family protein